MQINYEVLDAETIILREITIGVDNIGLNLIIKEIKSSAIYEIICENRIALRIM